MQYIENGWRKVLNTTDSMGNEQKHYIKRERGREREDPCDNYGDK